MKRNLLIAAAALSAVTMGSAFAAQFTIDFEKNWDFSDGDVNEYYNGGIAADGTSGANLGVFFVGVSGLSNDTSFTYYSNAPSMQGTAYAHTFATQDKAFMNVAAGVTNALSFFYSSPSDAVGAIKAFSGLNGTGALLGALDVVTNSSSDYNVWPQVAFAFSGIAHSFDLTGSANRVALDNISAVPLPSAIALLAPALIGFASISRKKNSHG